MAELLQEYTAVVTGPDGTLTPCAATAKNATDGTWIGWLEFEPDDPEEQR